MILKEAYSNLYALVEADPDDHFILTSSGAEAANHVVFSAYLDITRKTGKNHYLSSNIDEAPAIMSMSRLHELGCVFQMAEANPSGQITVGSIAEMITPRTALLSLSWANGLTGVIQPVREISELCRERGILFHVDATHVLGKGEFTFKGSGADLLTFNGEEFGGPPGTGGLYIRKGVELSPLILGGNEQAQMRGGSIYIPALIQLAEAADKAKSLSDHVCMEIARLREIFEQNVKGQVLFKDRERLPHISTLLFPGATSDALAYLLDRRGVSASFGGGKQQHLMHILKSCGIEEPLCHCGLSITLASDATEEEVKRSCTTINEIASQLQTYSEHIYELR